jgi:hypothetical protein
MRARLLVLAVLGILALVAPAAADARTNAASREGKVTVDAKITRFAVADRRIVARGVLSSKIEGAGESQAAKKAVTFAVAAQAGRCHVLTLTLDDLQLDLLGLRVDLSEVNLRIHALRRGQGSGILGRLFCALSNGSIRLRGASAASADRELARTRQVVRSLNTRLKEHPMRAFRASARLSADDNASTAQAAPSCRVLNLILGPLDLNLLGLVVELYGPSRNAPVTLAITSFPGQGVLGDLFCGLSGGPR